MLAIAAVITGVLAVAFAIVAIVAWRADTTLSERGRTAAATVVVANYQPQGTSSVTVRFTDANGATHDEPIDVSGAPQATGTAVTITYDPQNPATLRFAGADAATNMGPLGWLGVAALFALLAVVSVGVRMLTKRRRTA